MVIGKLKVSLTIATSVCSCLAIVALIGVGTCVGLAALGCRLANTTARAVTSPMATEADRSTARSAPTLQGWPRRPFRLDRNVS
jgi:hypothetical protein